VTAELKSDSPECITMSLFAVDHGKNARYSIGAIYCMKAY
jgi:hypothetical protein